MAALVFRRGLVLRAALFPLPLRAEKAAGGAKKPAAPAASAAASGGDKKAGASGDKKAAAGDKKATDKKATPAPTDKKGAAAVPDKKAKKGTDSKTEKKTAGGSINVFKEGAEPPLKPDSEYPSWLWSLELKPKARSADSYTPAEGHIYLKKANLSKIKKANFLRNKK